MQNNRENKDTVGQKDSEEKLEEIDKISNNIEEHHKSNDQTDQDTAEIKIDINSKANDEVANNQTKPTSNLETSNDEAKEASNNSNESEVVSKNNNSDNDTNEEKEEDEEGQFTDGEELTFLKIRFPGNAKSFPFILKESQKFHYGQKVVAMSDRGMTVGYINSFPYKVNFSKDMLPIQEITKAATEEDLLKQKENISKERKAESLCINLIEKHNLNMTLTHVEFTQFGKKAVFYFNAPERVDFRELVKDLVSGLKMRIELRQISVRDRSAALGAIGSCGRQTCCSYYLNNYGNVSIKLAKNQNLALLPSKLNGVCGQTKCCMKFEDDVYTQKRKILPKESSFIMTKNGDKGKILKLHLILEQFEMLTDTGKKRRYTIEQYDPKRNLPTEWSFPERFDHIVNETSDIIGIDLKAQAVLEEKVETRFVESSPEEIISNLKETDYSNKEKPSSDDKNVNSTDNSKIKRPVKRPDKLKRPVKKVSDTKSDVEVTTEQENSPAKESEEDTSKKKRYNKPNYRRNKSKSFQKNRPKQDNSSTQEQEKPSNQDGTTTEKVVSVQQDGEKKKPFNKYKKRPYKKYNNKAGNASKDSSDNVESAPKNKGNSKE